MFAAIALLALATVSSGLGYYLYYKSLTRPEDATVPNKWSWLIWSVGMAVEAATYNAITQDPLKVWIFYASTGVCIGITVAIWWRATWQMPSLSEFIAVALSVLAIVVWLVFQEAWWAHLIAIAAVPVGFWPTWVSALKRPEHERTWAWPLWTVSDLATLAVILLRLEDPRELPYAALDAACHLVICCLIWRGLRVRGLGHARVP